MIGGRILDNHVEKIGDGARRRLDLLTQESGQCAIEALVRFRLRQDASLRICLERNRFKLNRSRCGFC